MRILRTWCRRSKPAPNSLARYCWRAWANTRMQPHDELVSGSRVQRILPEGRQRLAQPTGKCGLKTGPELGLPPTRTPSVSSLQHSRAVPRSGAGRRAPGLRSCTLCRAHTQRRGRCADCCGRSQSDKTVRGLVCIGCGWCWCSIRDCVQPCRRASATIQSCAV